MNEADLARGQELYRRRKVLAQELKAVREGIALGPKLDRLRIAIWGREALNRYQPYVGEATLESADASDALAIIEKLHAERLKDMDASLRALGLEPPDEALVKLVKQ